MTMTMTMTMMMIMMMGCYVRLLCPRSVTLVVLEETPEVSPCKRVLWVVFDSLTERMLSLSECMPSIQRCAFVLEQKPPEVVQRICVGRVVQDCCVRASERACVRPSAEV
jgi:hypothetical protein